MILAFTEDGELLVVGLNGLDMLTLMEDSPAVMKLPADKTPSGKPLAVVIVWDVTNEVIEARLTDMIEREGGDVVTQHVPQDRPEL